MTQTEQIIPRSGTSAITPAVADHVVATIVNNCDPTRIIVFGSTATGHAGPDGMLTATSGFVLGAEDRESFKGQCSLSLVYPASCDCEWNADLSDQLLKLEELRYRSTSSSTIASVFRSLQVAYQAARNPTETRMTLYDIGTRVVLWISALEVLLHAGVANVNRRDVTAFVKACPWISDQLIEDDVPAKVCA